MTKWEDLDEDEESWLYANLAFKAKDSLRCYVRLEEELRDHDVIRRWVTEAVLRHAGKLCLSQTCYASFMAKIEPFSRAEIELMARDARALKDLSANKRIPEWDAAKEGLASAIMYKQWC